MNTAIGTLLVANRGEIARRVIRTCRLMGIRTVAVFSDPDEDAPFVADADEAIRLPGATPAETYLRADLIIEAARASGADAVHPGYGFLSEDAGFARACADNGLTLVGPPAEAIELMGDKLRSKELMADIGVPVLRGVEVTRATTAELADAAERIGFPLLIKASAGGGGRGMRVVRSQETLADAVAGARREAGAAFGRDTVFLERYVEAPRHIEVQVFADDHGNVVSLFERECSIQRRHQKIVEECPSPVVDEPLRARLGEAAVAAARAVDYRGAGTVEFVMAPDGDFYFLEMNTRLQVEHPVTEEVTGLDLVRLQILVAEGHPLPEEAVRPGMQGHAIEVRLYAEDPLRGFLPVTGQVERFHVEPLPGLRVEAGIRSGSAVSPHYDPMLAKLVCHAPSRGEAARRLAAALRRMRVDGIVTNRDLLVRILEHPGFLAGETDTHFLERHDPRVLGASLVPPESAGLHALAAALAGQAGQRSAARVLATIPSGWRNNRSSLNETAYEVEERVIRVGYQLTGREVVAQIDGGPRQAVLLHSCTPRLVDLEVAGARRRYEVLAVGERVYVHSALGGSTLKAIDRFPDPDVADTRGSLIAPMPGTVQRVLVEPGQPVAAGTPMVVLEAMKMEHTVSSPADGRIAQVLVAPGQQVEGGGVLVVFAEDETPADGEAELDTAGSSL
ncbi:biotin carboxylase N-terminal domain-containing protein [Sphaerisporangium sp. NPDC088356]|uniref:acetyl/propionyl/methylcrotonyl-CoA carboxylase subunit alpha n=1 Tax=Sphaerisporangium sp. NPDC088356 TaxID=3154871 RepID=UPI003418ABB3